MGRLRILSGNMVRHPAMPCEQTLRRILHRLSQTLPSQNAQLQKYPECQIPNGARSELLGNFPQKV
jgi:hypothetical protein